MVLTPADFKPENNPPRHVAAKLTFSSGHNGRDDNDDDGGDEHQWNPHQKAPATAWEAEIDRLMRAQASAVDAKKRKEAFDRVQQIAVEQQPFIYLVNKDTLVAIASTVKNAQPSTLRPETYWNVEELALK